MNKPLRAEKTPELPLVEPSGFRAWWRAEYTRADPDLPYGQIPADLRELFKP